MHGSLYSIVLDQTTRTIIQRAENFRNLILAVTFIVVAPLASAFVMRRAAPLILTILVIPICGLSCFLDIKIVAAWRHEVLAAWRNHDVDLFSFRRAVSASPSLPGDTLNSMLATLPSTPDLISEQDLSKSTRAAIVAKSEYFQADCSDTLALRTGVSIILGAALLVAFTLGVCQSMSLASLLIALPLLKKRLKHRRDAAFRNALLFAGKNPISQLFRIDG